MFENDATSNHPDGKLPKNSEESFLVHSLLSGMGDFFFLKQQIDVDQLNREILPFESNWRIYNSLKPHILRQGLSLTSLDGNLSGDPDLESLLETYKNSGKLYSESDFNTPTVVVKNSKILSELFKLFPIFGRSHFLKFGAGGFFPPHRDLDHSCFRLLVPCHYTSQFEFAFTLEDKILNLIPGRLTFVNTRKCHSVFSFQSNAILLVLNIPATLKNYEIIRKNINPN